MRDNKEPTAINVGELLVLSFGSYSGYCIGMIGRATKIITADVWDSIPVDEYKGDWLVKNGYVIELDHRELNSDDVWANQQIVTIPPVTAGV